LIDNGSDEWQAPTLLVRRSPSDPVVKTTASYARSRSVWNWLNWLPCGTGTGLCLTVDADEAAGYDQMTRTSCRARGAAVLRGRPRRVRLR